MDMRHGPGLIVRAIRSNSKLMARFGVVSSVAIVGLFALPGIAFAQSSFNWYMQGVLTGFNSRTWSFPTNGAETISSYDCSWEYPGAAGNNYTLQLTQNEPFYLPDRNAGRAYYPCPDGPTVYSYDFGSQPSGSYHFTVVGEANPYGIGYVKGYVYYP